METVHYAMHNDAAVQKGHELPDHPRLDIPRLRDVVMACRPGRHLVSSVAVVANRPAGDVAWNYYGLLRSHGFSLVLVEPGRGGRHAWVWSAGDRAMVTNLLAAAQKVSTIVVLGNEDRLAPVFDVVRSLYRCRLEVICARKRNSAGIAADHVFFLEDLVETYGLCRGVSLSS